jgi:hypothetical protein
MHSILSDSKYLRLNWTWSAVEQGNARLMTMTRVTTNTCHRLFRSTFDDARELGLRISRVESHLGPLSDRQAPA